jgi:hypothetical protein
MVGGGPALAPGEVTLAEPCISDPGYRDRVDVKPTKLVSGNGLHRAVGPLALVALVAVTWLAAQGQTEVPGPEPSAPSPTATAPLPTPGASMSSPPAAYAFAPTRAVEDWLASNLLITFRPLTSDELASVRLTVTDARRLALADPGPRYGPGDAHVTWEKVGCVYLGYYTGPMQSSLGYRLPQFAYLVQTLAPPVPNYPGLNLGMIPIDAKTGSMGTRFGGYDLGTTCGAVP